MRYIQDPVTLELVPADEYVPRTTHHLVMPDIQPYRSQIDGRMITSRSEHREHLKANNCYEVGNETKAHMALATQRRKDPTLRPAIIENLRRYGVL